MENDNKEIDQDKALLENSALDEIIDKNDSEGTTIPPSKHGKKYLWIFISIISIILFIVIFKVCTRISERNALHKAQLRCDSIKKVEELEKKKQLDLLNAENAVKERKRKEALAILQATPAYKDSVKKAEYKAKIEAEKQAKLAKIEAEKQARLAKIEAERQKKQQALDEKKAKKLAEEEKLLQAKQTRQRNIDSQFSGWDGSHYEVEKYIKQRMNDPDSYEHVSTSYRDFGRYIMVTTKYRGTNSFGAKILDVSRLKVELNNSGKAVSVQLID